MVLPIQAKSVVEGIFLLILNINLSLRPPTLEQFFLDDILELKLKKNYNQKHIFFKTFYTKTKHKFFNGVDNMYFTFTVLERQFLIRNLFFW